MADQNDNMQEMTPDQLVSDFRKSVMNPDPKYDQARTAFYRIQGWADGRQLSPAEFAGRILHESPGLAQRIRVTGLDQIAAGGSPTTEPAAAGPAAAPGSAPKTTPPPAGSEDIWTQARRGSILGVASMADWLGNALDVKSGPTWLRAAPAAASFGLKQLARSEREKAATLPAPSGVLATTAAAVPEAIGYIAPYLAVPGGGGAGANALRMGAVEGMRVSDRGPAATLEAGAQGALTGGVLFPAAERFVGPITRKVLGDTVLSRFANVALPTGAISVLQGESPEEATAHAIAYGTLAAPGGVRAPEKPARAATEPARTTAPPPAEPAAAPAPAGPLALSQHAQGALDLATAESARNPKYRVTPTGIARDLGIDKLKAGRVYSELRQQGKIGADGAVTSASAAPAPTAPITPAMAPVPPSTPPPAAPASLGFFRAPAPGSPPEDFAAWGRAEHARENGLPLPPDALRWVLRQGETATIPSIAPQPAAPAPRAETPAPAPAATAPSPAQPRARGRRAAPAQPVPAVPPPPVVTPAPAARVAVNPGESITWLAEDGSQRIRDVKEVREGVPYVVIKGKLAPAPEGYFKTPGKTTEGPPPQPGAPAPQSPTVNMAPAAPPTPGEVPTVRLGFAAPAGEPVPSPAPPPEAPTAPKPARAPRQRNAQGRFAPAAAPSTPEAAQAPVAVAEPVPPEAPATATAPIPPRPASEPAAPLPPAPARQIQTEAPEVSSAIEWGNGQSGVVTSTLRDPQTGRLLPVVNGHAVPEWYTSGKLIHGPIEVGQPTTPAPAEPSARVAESVRAAEPPPAPTIPTAEDAAAARARILDRLKAFAGSETGTQYYDWRTRPLEKGDVMPGIFDDLRIVGRDIATRTKANFEAWRNEMVQALGQQVDRYLLPIWHEITQPLRVGSRLTPPEAGEPAGTVLPPSLPQTSEPPPRMITLTDAQGNVTGQVPLTPDYLSRLQVPKTMPQPSMPPPEPTAGEVATRLAGSPVHPGATPTPEQLAEAQRVWSGPLPERPKVSTGWKSSPEAEARTSIKLGGEPGLTPEEIANRFLEATAPRRSAGPLYPADLVPHYGPEARPVPPRRPVEAPEPPPGAPPEGVVEVPPRTPWFRGQEATETVPATRRAEQAPAQPTPEQPRLAYPNSPATADWAISNAFNQAGFLEREPLQRYIGSIRSKTGGSYKSQYPSGVRDFITREIPGNDVLPPVRASEVWVKPTADGSVEVQLNGDTRQWMALKHYTDGRSAPPKIGVGADSLIDYLNGVVATEQPLRPSQAAGRTSGAATAMSQPIAAVPTEPPPVTPADIQAQALKAIDERTRGIMSMEQLQAVIRNAAERPEAATERQVEQVTRAQKKAKRTAGTPSETIVGEPTNVLPREERLTMQEQLQHAQESLGIRTNPMAETLRVPEVTRTQQPEVMARAVADLAAQFPQLDKPQLSEAIANAVRQYRRTKGIRPPEPEGVPVVEMNTPVKQVRAQVDQSKFTFKPYGRDSWSVVPVGGGTTNIHVQKMGKFYRVFVDNYGLQARSNLIAAQMDAINLAEAQLAGRSGPAPFTIKNIGRYEQTGIEDNGRKIKYTFTPEGGGKPYENTVPAEMWGKLQSMGQTETPGKGATVAKASPKKVGRPAKNQPPVPSVTPPPAQPAGGIPTVRMGAPAAPATGGVPTVNLGGGTPPRSSAPPEIPTVKIGNTPPAQPGKRAAEPPPPQPGKRATTAPAQPNIPPGGKSGEKPVWDRRTSADVPTAGINQGDEFTIMVNGQPLTRVTVYGRVRDHAAQVVTPDGLKAELTWAGGRNNYKVTAPDGKQHVYSGVKAEKTGGAK